MKFVFMNNIYKILTVKIYYWQFKESVNGRINCLFLLSFLGEMKFQYFINPYLINYHYKVKYKY